MPDSILAVARRHRQALLERDRETMRGMVVAYEPIYQRIQAALQRLQGQLDSARADGETINTAALRRRGRLDSLLAQVRQEMDAFAVTAEGQVTFAQRMSVDAGDADAQELVRRGGPSIVGAFDRLPTRIVERMVGFLADGSPLRDVIATYGTDAVAKVERALVGGIALGTGPMAIAREVRKASGEPLQRALTLARTETLRAYNSTTQERYARAGVPRWQWLATLSGSSCVVCIAMHGTVHSMAEEFGSHVKCRCTIVPLWEDEDELPIKETGETWFARQPEDVKKGLLTPVKYEAYRMGEIHLADLVGKKSDDRWGTQRYERSFKRILEGRRAVRQPGPTEDEKRSFRQAFEALPTPTDPDHGEQILRGLDFEVCYVWQESNLVLAKPGTRDQIVLTERERELVKDNLFQHNHPHDKSFSRDDARFIADQDPAEFVAVSPKRRFHCRRPVGGWGDRFFETWEQNFRTSFQRLVKERRKRNMTDQVFDERVYSDTMKRTAQELALDYTEEVW